MLTFGQELKRERERRGIHLAQIAEETKIPQRFLEAIESSRVEAIPGRFYQRAYIRAYAGRLGLDQERFVAAHEFASSGEAEALALQAKGRAGSRPAIAGALRWVALGVVGLGLTGAAAAVWQRAPEDTPPPSQVSAFQSAGSLTGQQLPGSPLVLLVPFVEDELAGVVLPDTVRLTLRVNEPCWLEVWTDGERVMEGIKLRGFEKEFRAEEICFSLGNAGGVSYWLDDDVGKPLGEPGHVLKDVCVSRDNASDFVEREL